MQSPHRVTCRGKMADLMVVTVDLPPTPPLTADFDSALSIPPVDATLFSQHQFIDSDCNLGEDLNDLEGLDFDFILDDFSLTPADFDDLIWDPSKSEETNSFKMEPELDPNFDRFDFGTNLAPYQGVFKSASSDLRHHSGDGDFWGDYSLHGSGVLNSGSPVLESNQISGYLNLSSPESDGSNRGVSENSVGDVKEVNCPSPDTQGSGNCKSHVSEHSSDCSARSVSSSPNLKSNSIINVFVDHEIKSEDSSNYIAPGSLLKRKKESDDCYVESRITKCTKSNSNAENDDNSGLSEEEEKRKARLMRNRESAQLSRQRKKHYVDELEDKVRMMHSTIQDLNAKISFFMAENVTLRKQMGSGGGGVAAPPPQMPPHPPGMYSHPAMMYPWMPCAPPYVMKPQGSQLPLVPIPRLKPQQPAQSRKVSKKVESKKNEAQKSKKVAGVSFLGLILFIMLFGGLVPVINVRYGGVRQALNGGENYVGDGYYEKHHGRLLMVNGTANGEKFSGRGDYSGTNSSFHCSQRGNGGGGEPNADEFARVGNGSERLVASLYVPRNDKLVKIDGNLIIHSVLASEKAVASNTEVDGETGLAVPVGLVPAIPVPGVGRGGIRNPHLRALRPDTEDRENLKSTANDGSLHQWFREGLAGPMLSSGMCTEVFQFDVSPASVSGAIIPASTQKNISEEQGRNSTHVNKGRNRRFLHDHPIPLPECHHNTSEEHRQRNSRNDNLDGNNLTSSMVVSVLVDPRETGGGGDVDGVMGKNSISPIFVVVLIDSVKYVTYSCMLPFLGSASHLVTN
ncbi:bZIP transcription factor 17-like [Primulina tabacum]|uniref:bZIP transcription factor 17-like n=1 Tax=Primulina tabacum TaxID=48773 RepID=UPI003F59F595